MSVRDHLHEAVQATVPIDDELPDGTMLIGWVVVAEWMAPDGDRWLSRSDGGAAGKRLPEWQTQGYLHSALFDSGGFSSDDGGERPE